ncbi:hypothetical protein LAX5112_03681 [Roseibium alexandrii]|uniref:Uncharacterized protein n=1 Tax=Roseibium alexandrii TaxID=388408 RepID=A0A0M7AGX3_9HYPH|nr:hypothetical protein LAX5112_03681 [Roseibium alexandrii]
MMSPNSSTPDQKYRHVLQPWCTYQQLIDIRPIMSCVDLIHDLDRWCKILPIVFMRICAAKTLVTPAGS